jgi:hypothetical protein
VLKIFWFEKRRVRRDTYSVKDSTSRSCIEKGHGSLKEATDHIKKVYLSNKDSSRGDKN